MTPNRAKRELRDSCGEFPLFRDLGEEGLEELVRMALCHEYPENNYLFYQDDPPDELYLVLDGRVKRTLTHAGSGTVVLSHACAGDLVGAAGVFGEEPQPANAITASSCRLAKFKGGPFRRWVEKRPAMQSALLPYVASRLRLAEREVGVHALLSVRDRLLYTLTRMAERDGRPGPDGEGVVVERPTHQELADRIGASREAVTRTLDQLLKEGVLEGEGKVVEVPQSALVLRGQ